MPEDDVPPPATSPATLRWWQRWQTTLLAAFLFVALVVLLAQIADLARDYDQAEAAALAKQHDTAVALSRATQLFVDRYVIGTAVVAEALALRGADDADALRPLLERLRRHHPQVAALALDPAGRVVASAPAGLEGRDLSDRELFGALAAGAASVVTTVAPRVPVLVVGSAARGPDGALLGGVAATIPADALGEELRVQLTGDTEALVVDGEGFVLVHGGFPDLEWSRRDFSALPLVAEALAGRAARSRGYASPLTGELHMGAMVPVAGTAWAAGVEQPVEAALWPARRARSAALWVAASVLVLSLATALLLSAWLNRPIERLAEGAAAFARGEFDHRIRVEAHNELGWLANRFNAMATRLRETTARWHAALDEAHAERRRLATTLESIPDGVLVCDANGRLVVANEAARRIVGEGFLPGVHIDQLGTGTETRTLAGEPVPPGARPLHRALRGEATHDLRLAVKRPDGELRYVSATAAPVESGTGERLGAVAVLRDETDRQALEAMKDQFIARASHELRTPLTAIRGTLGFLDRRVEGLSAQARELLGMASRNVQQMLDLVDDLLDASRLSSGTVTLKAERLELAEALANAVRLVRPAAGEAGVRLELRVDPALALEADPVKLDQVLANLLGNAVKFSRAGGRVEVSARAVDGSVEIRVADQGIGLAREHLEQVFEPFYQVDRPIARRPRGTGLGLTIARSLVELHQGRIWAESAGPGRGSTFVIRLPASGAIGVPRKRA